MGLDSRLKNPYSVEFARAYIEGFDSFVESCVKDFQLTSIGDAIFYDIPLDIYIFDQVGHKRTQICIDSLEEGGELYLICSFSDLGTLGYNKQHSLPSYLEVHPTLEIFIGDCIDRWCQGDNDGIYKDNYLYNIPKDYKVPFKQFQVTTCQDFGTLLITAIK